MIYAQFLILLFDSYLFPWEKPWVFLNTFSLGETMGFPYALGTGKNHGCWISTRMYDRPRFIYPSLQQGMTWFGMRFAPRWLDVEDLCCFSPPCLTSSFTLREEWLQLGVLDISSSSHQILRFLRRMHGFKRECLTSPLCLTYSSVLR